MKDIEPALAKALGFPKPEYTAVERERRWLCSEFPRDLIRQTLMMSVDEFESDLAGLTLIEAEFETDEAARAFATPAFRHP